MGQLPNKVVDMVTPSPPTMTPDLDPGMPQQPRGASNPDVGGGLSQGEIFLVVVAILIVVGTVLFILRDNVLACVVRCRRAHLREVAKSGDKGREVVGERVASLEDVELGIVVGSLRAEQPEIADLPQTASISEVVETPQPPSLETTLPAAALTADKAPASLEPPPVKPSLEFSAASSGSEWDTEDEWTDAPSDLASAN